MLGDLQPLALGAAAEDKRRHYQQVHETIRTVLEGEDDWVAALATIASILHEAFAYFHWTGFYLAGKRHEELVIGPYQGHMGCLRIPYSKGVCGAAARMRHTQLVPDVAAFAGYIACDSSTQSEIVVPVVASLQAGAVAQGGAETSGGSGNRTAEHTTLASATAALLAVLDVDSDFPAAFDAVDQEQLEQLCTWLGSRPWQ